MPTYQIKCLTRACGKSINQISPWEPYQYGLVAKGYCEHCLMSYWIYQRCGGVIKVKDRIDGEVFEERNRSIVPIVQLNRIIAS